jgi:hypothetical protein
MTLLTENSDSEDASQEDLVTWAQTYGQTFPVLSDVGGEVLLRFSPREGFALPAISLLGPGVEVIIATGRPDTKDIEGALP